MVFNLFRRPKPQAPPPAPEPPTAPAEPPPAPEAPQAVAAPPAPPPPQAASPTPTAPAVAVEQEGKNVAQSLEKTRVGLFGAVRSLFRQRRELDPDFWDDLEERLLQADLGAHTTADLVDELRERHGRRRFETPEDAEAALREQLVELLGSERASLNLPEPLAVVLIVGVNGVGKTTSIAKLSHLLAGLGRKPLLVAGDTFRAAAIDQLKIWGQRTRTPVVAQEPGSDPGAVVFDGLQAAKTRGADVLIIDTAGRLHTKTNLMEELRKVRRIIERQLPGAPHETLLVLDAVTGQNGLVQAKTFAEAVGVTGLILAKLDSSAKGGVVFSIAQEIKLPIKFIGTGEQLQDFAPFDPEEFAAALFE
jgi:fused signal recognition particle receptor